MDLTEDEQRLLECFKAVHGDRCRQEVLLYVEAVSRAQEALIDDLGIQVSDDMERSFIKGVNL